MSDANDTYQLVMKSFHGSPVFRGTDMLCANCSSVWNKRTCNGLAVPEREWLLHTVAWTPEERRELAKECGAWILSPRS